MTKQFRIKKYMYIANQFSFFKQHKTEIYQNKQQTKDNK